MPRSFGGVCIGLATRMPRWIGLWAGTEGKRTSTGRFFTTTGFFNWVRSSPPPLLFSSARFLNRFFFRNAELTLWYYVSGRRTRGQERDHA